LTPRVWAPLAREVALDLGDRRLDMRSEAGGWFTHSGQLTAGTDYRFVLDQGEPLPDPRSRWQPAGPLGPSRVQGEDFPWSDQSWAGFSFADAVLYELHVGTFSPAGTFDGVTERLDHLVELGVSAIELMPVNEFSGSRNWGYDGVDLFAPHHAYGGPPGLKRLVDACHRRGLGVLLDVVYNHLGPVGNILPRFGPYFTSRYATPWGEAINFDGPGSDEVRAFVFDNAVQWFREYHVDGLRLDAVHAIFDTSAVHVLEELAARVHELAERLGRPLWLIAESDLNDPRLLRDPELGGYGLDAQWNDDFHHALHAALTGERSGYYVDFGRLADIGKALQDVFVYDGRYSRFRGRRHGRPALGLGGNRFVGYLQNHDQVGNRARGERSSRLMSPGRLRAGAALVFTAPFIPMLFMGEEWGASTPFPFFADHQDPQVARATIEGRRREFEAFGWRAQDIPDPQVEATFAAARLDWAELDREPHRAVLDWHRQLAALRRATPELRDGRRDRIRVEFDERAGWLVVDRPPLRVACNLGSASVRLARLEGLRPLMLWPRGGLEGDRLCGDGVAVLLTGAG
jgi:maltooligosyltrehalose trehalohydrolase